MRDGSLRRDAMLVLATAAASFAVAVPLGVASLGAGKEDVYPSWPGTDVTFVGLDWSCSYGARHTIVVKGKKTTVPPQVNCSRESTGNGVHLNVTGTAASLYRCGGDDGTGTVKWCNRGTTMTRNP